MHFNSSYSVDRPKETQSNRFPKPQYIYPLKSQHQHRRLYRSITKQHSLRWMVFEVQTTEKLPGQARPDLSSKFVRSKILTTIIVVVHRNPMSFTFISIHSSRYAYSYVSLPLFVSCRWMDGRRLGLSSSTHKHIDRPNYAASERKWHTERYGHRNRPSIWDTVFDLIKVPWYRYSRSPMGFHLSSIKISNNRNKLLWTRL